MGGALRPVRAHAAGAPAPDRLAAAWDAFGERMADHYPFFHPRYAGQMLKPPHPVAVAGYLAAMLVNPNNHALDGGPGASGLEVEVVDQLRVMFGLPSPGLGHLTSSGTIANLEALWIAREVHPGKRIVHCAAAHYTHARMCELLGVDRHRGRARRRRAASTSTRCEAECARGDVGTVVLTTGSTGLGAIDRVDEALALRERYGVRLHVDGAYGGFFTLLARGDDPLVAPAPYAAIAQCDSVVVDPHKHGLQPYGCGAVLFADPAVQRVYRHDSPFTYFTEADLHLGEISLECSRAGAAAAGLWLTLQALPLERDEGLGAVLAAGRRAALDWAARLRASEVLDAARRARARHRHLPAAASARCRRSTPPAAPCCKAGMEDPDDPVFLSTLYLGRDALAARHPELEADADGARVLRSVLMKPEHEQAVGWLHERVEGLARAALA